MRKLLILSALVLASINLFAEPIYKQIKYPNGLVRMEGLFDEGRPVGEIKRYHENGVLQGPALHHAPSRPTVVAPPTPVITPTPAFLFPPHSRASVEIL